MFDDYGQAALGKTGQRLVYLCIYSTILITPVILHLTCVESLQQIFYHRGVSRLVGGGIVAAIILPLAQATPVLPHRQKCLFLVHWHAYAQTVMLCSKCGVK